MSQHDTGFLKFFGIICLIPLVLMAVPSSSVPIEGAGTFIWLVVLIGVIPFVVWACRR